MQTPFLHTRILVIEDNPDDEMLLLHMLRKGKLQDSVQVVRDGQHALNILTHDESKIDDLVAIFLDLNIPTINGLELLAMIRNDDNLMHLPVIVMTSSNSPEDIRQCEKLRVMAYVQKPVSFSAFTKAIADIFHKPRPSSPSLATELVE